LRMKKLREDFFDVRNRVRHDRLPSLKMPGLRRCYAYAVPGRL
jgi:hypothetical protein